MKLSLVISVDETAFDAVAVRGGWQDGIRMAAGLGYDGVELAIRDPQTIDAAELHAVLRETGLSAVALGTGQAFLTEGLSLTSDDAGIRQRAIERIKAHIRVASTLSAAVIIGLIRGRIIGTRSTADERLLTALARVLPVAERHGLRVIIEPINRDETDYLTTVDEALDIIDRVGSPILGVLADTFHMSIEEPSIERALRRCAGRLAHVHVADSNRRAPGFGHLDFDRIVTTLKELGYAGFLSAEVLPYPDPLGAAKQTIEYLRPML